MLDRCQNGSCVIQIDSLLRVPLQKIDLFVIDEVESILSQLTSEQLNNHLMIT